MDALVLEGTLVEVRERLDELRLEPNTYVGVTVERVDTPFGGETRNGAALIPQRQPGTVVTSELVFALSDD
ncbi:MAG: hypothetical protein ACO1SX_22845 [Actinomycetota bacterium]